MVSLATLKKDVTPYLFHPVNIKVSQFMHKKANSDCILRGKSWDQENICNRVSPQNSALIQLPSSKSWVSNITRSLWCHMGHMSDGLHWVTTSTHWLTLVKQTDELWPESLRFHLNPLSSSLIAIFYPLREAMLQSTLLRCATSKLGHKSHLTLCWDSGEFQCICGPEALQSTIYVFSWSTISATKFTVWGMLVRRLQSLPVGVRTCCSVTLLLRCSGKYREMILGTISVITDTVKLLL